MAEEAKELKSGSKRCRRLEQVWLFSEVRYVSSMMERQQGVGS